MYEIEFVPIKNDEFVCNLKLYIWVFIYNLCRYIPRVQRAWLIIKHYSHTRISLSPLYSDGRIPFHCYAILVPGNSFGPKLFLFHITHWFSIFLEILYTITVYNKTVIIIIIIIIRCTNNTGWLVIGSHVECNKKVHLDRGPILQVWERNEDKSGLAQWIQATTHGQQEAMTESANVCETKRS